MKINERLMMPCYEYTEYLNAKPLKLPPTMPLIFFLHTPDNMVHLLPVSRNIGHQEIVLCTPIALLVAIDLDILSEYLQHNKNTLHATPTPKPLQQYQ